MGVLGKRGQVRAETRVERAFLLSRTHCHGGPRTLTHLPRAVGTRAGVADEPGVLMVADAPGHLVSAARGWPLPPPLLWTLGAPFQPSCFTGLQVPGDREEMRLPSVFGGEKHRRLFSRSKCHPGSCRRKEQGFQGSTALGFSGPHPLGFPFPARVHGWPVPLTTQRERCAHACWLSPIVGKSGCLGYPDTADPGHGEGQA